MILLEKGQILLLKRPKVLCNFFLRSCFFFNLLSCKLSYPRKLYSSLSSTVHSVTKAPYFSKKPIITKFSKLKSFTLIWSRVFKKDKYHFLFHFSKHSIYTKVVLSSPNLTDINQDTKNDLFSIVSFVFNKALVPFVQIWAARKITL